LVLSATLSTTNDGAKFNCHGGGYLAGVVFLGEHHEQSSRHQPTRYFACRNDPPHSNRAARDYLDCDITPSQLEQVNDGTLKLSLLARNRQPPRRRRHG
jgi:hypothetical protein